MTRLARTTLGPVALAVLALVGCDQRAPSGKGPLVVASVYPLYEFTRQVAGNEARVVSLVPAGTEPHDWEPSAQDLTRIREARVLVYNGAGLDAWVSRLLAEHASPGTLVVRATEGIALLGSRAPADGGVSTPDPHVWLDPVLAQSMVETIRAALAKADQAHAAIYARNASAYTVELQKLHERFRVGLEHCARREVLASHAALAYLARRYNLTLAPVMGLTPEAEPTPARLASIVRFARDRKVKYIFTEPLVSPAIAETLAREVGARTLVFDPIEGVTRDEQAAGRGYVALMEDNLKNLRVALDCR